MPTLAAGSNITLALGDFDSVSVESRGVVSVEAVSGLGLAAGKIAEVQGARTFGPYQAGSIKVTAGERDVYYEIGDGRNTYNRPIILAQAGVASSVTGTLAETILAPIVIPGGMMGLNGVLRISASWSFTNSANTKTLKAVLGGTALASLSKTTQGGDEWFFPLRNRGSLSSQTQSNNVIPSGGGPLPRSINTAIDQTLTFTGTLALGTETITLEGYTVEVLPS